MKRRLLSLLVALAVWVPALGWAQTDADDLRARARELAAVGGQLYQDKDYAAAFTKLDEAYRILRVPTLGFYTGHCLENLGRWVEAAERYQEVTNLALPERSPELHASAREDAAKARAALLPRIPRLRVTLEVKGESAAPRLVSLDGKTLAASLLESPIPLDPGEHVVAASQGDDRVEEKVTVVEGGDTEVVLTLVLRRPAPGPEPPRPLPPAPVAAPVDNSAIRTAGWVVLGVGGAALVGGVVTGALLLAESSSLDAECVDQTCLATADVDTFNALRPTTTVLLAVGGAGVATGLLLALAFPDGEPAVTPTVGLGVVGLRARF